MTGKFNLSRLMAMILVLTSALFIHACNRSAGNSSGGLASDSEALPDEGRGIEVPSPEGPTNGPTPILKTRIYVKPVDFPNEFYEFELGTNPKVLVTRHYKSPNTGNTQAFSLSAPGENQENTWADLQEVESGVSELKADFPSGIKTLFRLQHEQESIKTISLTRNEMPTPVEFQVKNPETPPSPPAENSGKSECLQAGRTWVKIDHYELTTPNTGPPTCTGLTSSKIQIMVQTRGASTTATVLLSDQTAQLEPCPPTLDGAGNPVTPSQCFNFSTNGISYSCRTPGPQMPEPFQAECQFIPAGTEGEMPQVCAINTVADSSFSTQEGCQ